LTNYMKGKGEDMSDLEFLVRMLKQAEERNVELTERAERYERWWQEELAKNRELSAVITRDGIGWDKEGGNHEAI